MQFTTHHFYAVASFIEDEAGASLMEYALVGSLVLVVLVLLVMALDKIA